MSQTQWNRGAFLKVRLFFTFEVICSQIQMAPGNLDCDQASRRYHTIDALRPTLEFYHYRVLGYSLQGFCNCMGPWLKQGIPCERPSQLVLSNWGTLAAITRTLCAKFLICINHQLLSSSPKRFAVETEGRKYDGVLAAKAQAVLAGSLLQPWLIDAVPSIASIRFATAFGFVMHQLSKVENAILAPDAGLLVTPRSAAGLT
ncbi:hypothetical protein [Janthinobacterium sp. LB3P112]|uniref:hypothetical protein n=1 Tax=Janthinobacterium sp. LB3P112 TaxID=3424196 RepID=UPI003F24935E